MVLFKSSQGLFLVALLVCQAFTVPAMATAAPWIPNADLTTPRSPKAPQVTTPRTPNAPQGTVNIQGSPHVHTDGMNHGPSGHDDNGHGHGGRDDNGHGHGGHGGHGHGDHDGGRHG